MPRTRPPDAVVARRRERVLDHVIARGEVRIDDLTDRFGVSLMTMHRDLDALAGRRLLRKLRGRVAAYPALTMETAKRFRETLNRPQKQALSAAVLGEIRPGDTVLLDDSTTLFPLAELLIDLERLTVVTNSLEIARILGEQAEVILLGGRYTEFDSCVGPATLAQLRELRIDVGLVSATAIAAGRLHHPVAEYADLKRVALRVSARNILVADASKFGRTAAHTYGACGDYDLVVVDDEVSATERAAIRRGTELRVVSVEGSTRS